MGYFEKNILNRGEQRKVRVLDHKKRAGEQVREVTNVDKNLLREGVPELFYIKGKGFYWVTKFNNELQYSKHTGL
jgi:hypothetical protein